MRASGATLLLRVAAVLICAAAGLVLRSALTHDDDTGTAAGALPAAPVSAATGFRADAARSRRVAAGDTVLATARGDVIRVHDRPRSGARGTRLLRRRRVSGFPIPLTFPVRERTPEWVRVDLPTRPNGSTGWVRRHAVRFSVTGLSLTISLGRHELRLADRGRIVLRAAIGVGRALSPTPHGRYYVTDLLRTGKPRGFYGPYALGLSAHSTIFTHFDGGDGQVGVHGTNDPSSIGRDVSHGCIRVRNEVIRRLAARVPLGTPVTIRA